MPAIIVSSFVKGSNRPLFGAELFGGIESSGIFIAISSAQVSSGKKSSKEGGWVFGLLSKARKARLDAT